MRRGLTSSLVFIVLAAVAALVGTLVAGNRPLLGLDLQGGLAVVLQPTTDVDDESIDQAIEVIRNRVDAIGVAEPEITRQGDSIVVQLPGVDDSERALELVGQTAELRFRTVRNAFPNTPEGAAAVQSVLALEAFGADSIEDLIQVDPSETDPSGVDDAPVDDAPVEEAPATTDAPADDGAEENGSAPFDVEAVQIAATTTETPATSEVPADDAPAEEAPVTTPPVADPDDVITPPDEDEFGDVVVLPGIEGNFLYVLEPASASGTIVDDAQATLGELGGGWSVNLSFTGQGSIEFDQIAAQNVGQSLAIVLDGVVYSAPTIQQANFGGTAVITGNFGEEEAKDLALVLRFGALPVELEPATVQTVSATLGEEALDAGIIAGIIGLFLVGVFIIGYYRWAGAIALGGLAVSGALLWSFIALLGETSGLALTLAGATGIIVSIGVQVDSNIVYYERLKEEVRRGRSLRVAADQGFRGAFSTIVKADVGSLIGAALLYWLTVGPVRGFAFFLGIATILDLIVSYFYMRPALVLMARRFNEHPNRVIGVPDDQVAISGGAKATASAGSAS